MNVMTAVHLLQLTDTHLVGDPAGGMRGIVTLDTLRATLDLARRRCGGFQQLDAILATGDLVHDDPDGYRWIARELGVLGPPVLCLPGNHDDPALMSDVFAEAPFQYCGHHDCGHWRIVMLDSMLPGSAAGRLSDAELQRLENALADARYKHALVVLHHHPIPSNSVWLDTVALEEPQRFLEILAKHPRVRGVLWGHVHQAFDGMHGNIRMMATPSTCVQFKPLVVDFELDTRPPGFRLLSLQDDGRIDSRIEWLELNDGSKNGVATSGFL
jgi:Icc protein